MKSVFACLVALVSAVATWLACPPGPHAESVVDHVARNPSVESLGEVVGAQLPLGCEGKKVRLQSLVLGLTEDRLLGIAHYAGSADDGTFLEGDYSGQFAELVTKASQLRDFFLLDDATEERVWIESATWAIDNVGRFGFGALIGRSGNGKPFTWIRGQTECCSLITTTRCIKSPFYPCNFSCPGPGACTCTGFGFCIPIMAQRCEGECTVECDGGEGQSCKGPLTDCHCN